MGKLGYGVAWGGVKCHGLGWFFPLFLIFCSETADTNTIQIPGLGDEEDKVVDEVKTVALDESDDSEGENVLQVDVPESQPKNESKTRGLLSENAIKKKKANKAKQSKERKVEKVREEMTPAQLKARQRELEENSDMMAAADTFGFDVDDENTGENSSSAPAVLADDFFEFNRDGGKDAFAAQAAKVSAKLLELQTGKLARFFQF